MGIFDRFSTLLRSNINDLISSAEDPEKMLNQILVDMRGQLVEGEAAGRRRDRRREAPARSGRRGVQAGADWEQKAMLAIKEGRDDLAKQALVRQSEHVVARRSSSRRRGRRTASRPRSSRTRSAT